MNETASALTAWTAGQVAAGKQWVETWRRAGEALEALRQKELRETDTYRAVALLCRPADYTRPPFAPEPTSGLVEQQRWFTRARRRP